MSCKKKNKYKKKNVSIFNLFLFLFIGITLSLSSVNAFNISYSTSSNELLNEDGFITFTHDSAIPLNCSLLDGSTPIAYPKVNIEDKTYSIYYHNLSYGYHNLKISCFDGTDTEEVVDKFLVAEKKDNIPNLIVFLFVLFSPLFVKYFGLITRITKNNPYFEFVIYFILLCLTFLYGSTTSVYYDNLLFLYGRAVFGFSMAISFIELLFLEIAKINGQGGNNK